MAMFLIYIALLPKISESTLIGCAERSPTVFIDKLCNFSELLGPIPHTTSIGNGCRKEISSPGLTTVRPSGLLIPEAIFDTDLEVETPIEMVRPRSEEILSFNFFAIWGGVTFC